MRERGGDKIAGGTVTVRLADPHARRGKSLKFLQRGPNGLGMSFQNPVIHADQCRNRNRFGRREREVIKNPAIGGVAPGPICPHGIQPWRQCVARSRMQVFAETQKCFRADMARQTEPFRAESKPLASHPLAFVIVIPHAKMLLKVFLCVRQFVLRFGRNHQRHYGKTSLSLCSENEQSDSKKLVHWRHENKPVHDSAAEAPNEAQPPLIMMTPTTAEIRTAIEVLKMLDQRLNDQAAHSVMQLPNTELGDQYAEQIKARTIEQTSHIEKVSMQLQNWREELLQQQKQQVVQSV
jgi:hypothetical protein